MSKTLILIPTRLSATRLPGKPLLKINNISIISHVVKKAKESNIGDVYVAAEDQEIIKDVEKNGGKAILTGNHHKNGSERILECFEKIDQKDVDHIINLQGDEPLVFPEMIEAAVEPLINDPNILLLDEPFAALDILTIKMLQEIIVNLQSLEKITCIVCDHQARDLLSCVDRAIVLSNGKIIASGSPNEIINDTTARSAYFGDEFKIN